MDKIKYFFECYFNVSADYADIESLISEYISIESVEYVKDIKKELNDVRVKNDWKEFIDVAYSAGGRLIALDKCEVFVIKLIDLFNKN